MEDFGLLASLPKNSKQPTPRNKTETEKQKPKTKGNRDSDQANRDQTILKTSSRLPRRTRKVQPEGNSYIILLFIPHCENEGG